MCIGFTVHQDRTEEKTPDGTLQYVPVYYHLAIALNVEGGRARAPVCEVPREVDPISGWLRRKVCDHRWKNRLLGRGLTDLGHEKHRKPAA